MKKTICLNIFPFPGVVDSGGAPSAANIFVNSREKKIITLIE
jgi:hypothetical protein